MADNRKLSNLSDKPQQTKLEQVNQQAVNQQALGNRARECAGDPRVKRPAPGRKPLFRT